MLHSINILIARFRITNLRPFRKAFFSSLWESLAIAYAEDELVFPLGEAIVEVSSVFVGEVLDVFNPETYDGFLGQTIVGGLLKALECLEKLCNGEECGCGDEQGELPASAPLGATMKTMSLGATTTQSASQSTSQTVQVSTEIPQYGSKLL